MAVVTYPAANLGAPRRAPNRRNATTSQEHGVTVAALLGLSVMALGGAASLKFKKPSLAIGGLLVGTLAAALAFEAQKVTR